MTTTHQKHIHHFLDSNILLNLVIRWQTISESQKDCQKYIKCGSNKNITDRVHNEAETVLDKHRRVAYKYLDFFLDEVNSGKIRTDRDLHPMVFRFLNKYEGQKCPENMPVDRFRSLVNAIAGYFHNELINYLYDPTDRTFINMKNEIREEINNAKDSLDLICQNFLIENPNSYNDGTLTNLEKDLLDLGVHKPDHLILLDCHCLGLNHLKDHLAFITLDGRICDLEIEIRKIVSNILIFKP